MMAIITKQPRPAENCLDCGRIITGKRYLEQDGLCEECWQEETQRHIKDIYPDDK